MVGSMSAPLCPQRASAAEIATSPRRLGGDSFGESGTHVSALPASHDQEGPQSRDNMLGQCADTENFVFHGRGLAGKDAQDHA